MRYIFIIVASMLFSTQADVALAQTWNPKPNWKDSYAVGGKCYCDSNGFDHGLDKKTAPTPAGRKKVVAICGAIRAKLGVGPKRGRIPYNDIQCGNGPANDAPDEAGCPGRVDMGPSGCRKKGPKWDLASVYGKSILDSSKWQISSSSDQTNVRGSVDGNTDTRWATRTEQRPGQFFQIDMQQMQRFDQILLDSQGNPNDYPRGYRVLVSDDGTTWRGPVATGAGNGPITDIPFPVQQARYIRIEQTASDSQHWWSIHEMFVDKAD